jgi:hypothetical protein
MRDESEWNGFRRVSETKNETNNGGEGENANETGGTRWPCPVRQRQQTIVASSGGRAELYGGYLQSSQMGVWVRRNDAINSNVLYPSCKASRASESCVTCGMTAAET